MKTRDVRVNLQIKTQERLQSLDAVMGPSSTTFNHFTTMLVLGLLGHPRNICRELQTKGFKLQGKGPTD